MSESILLDVSEGVAVLTLNRPEKLNAFAGDMRERLVDALDHVASDPSVRVLVVTGAGRAFCSGGDVQHMVDLKARDAGYAELRPLLEAGRAIVTRLAALPFPTIAAVHGVAAGAGMNLALACDLRLASDEAKFGETFVRIGLHPDWGGSYALPRLVGTAKAMELAWTGEILGAEEALRLGLVQRVWPRASFDAEWRGFAARLAAAPQASVRGARETLRGALQRTLAQCLDAEIEAQAACWASTDAAEGLRAFVEKRAPVFGAGSAGGRSVASTRATWRFE